MSVTVTGAGTFSGRAAGMRAPAPHLSSVVDAIIVSENKILSENKIRIIDSNDDIRASFGPNGRRTPWVRKSVRNGAPGRQRHNAVTI